MATESANYIDGLDPSRPQGSESLGEADDHLTLIKRTLKDTMVGGENDAFDTPLRIGPRFLNSLSDNLNLSEFVTLSTDQAITGAKSFAQSIQANVVSPSRVLVRDDAGTPTLGDTGGNTHIQAKDLWSAKVQHPGKTTPILTQENFTWLMVNTVHPVGSIIFSIDNNNPQTRWPNTTWQKVAAGRLLVGVGTGTDINGYDRAYPAGDDAYGEYVHTITTEEMPSHAHGVQGDDDPANGRLTFDGSEVVQQFFDQTGSSHGFTNNTGGGLSHNNTSPTFGVYIWRRTA